MIKNKTIQVGSFALNIWQIAFGLLLVVYSLVILMTFQDYGITSDETHHVNYGADIVHWYMSGFQDRALFNTDNTYLYGGFFDTSAYLFSQIMPLDRYDANHLFNALFGLLGIVAAYRIGTLLGGSALGFFCALALLFTPRYYGHAFNNPKDIPFAVCYLWTLYYLLCSIQNLSSLSRSHLTKLGIATGLTLGIRVGGTLLWGYIALFWGLQYLFLRRGQKDVSLVRLFFQYFGVLAISYVVMLIFWPWAFTHPVFAIPEAVKTFSSFPEVHYSFFEGRYVGSNEIPWYYALGWLGLTLPDFVLFGLLLAVITCYRKRRNFLTHPIMLMVFAFLFPIAYAIIFRTPLYDGLRHLLFVVPPLVIVSTFGFFHVLQNLPRRYWQYVGWGITGILVAITPYEMSQLHPFQSAYFNTLIAGGIEQASKNYETNYWGNSYKLGAKWIDAHVNFSQEERKLFVSSASENVVFELNRDRFEFVTQPQFSDLYMGSTRFDKHRIIAGEVIHVIHAKTVPVLYIVRPDTLYQNEPFFAQSAFRHIHFAEQYAEQGNRDAAIESYQKAVQLMPEKNKKTGQIGQIYIKMGNLFFEEKKYQEAIRSYQNTIDYDAHNTQNCAIAYNNIGLMYAHQSQEKDALTYYQKAVELWPQYSKAHENIGDIYVFQKQPDRAIVAFQSAIDTDRNATKVYSKLAEIYMAKNDFDKAIYAYHKLIEKYPNDALNYYNVALLYRETGQNQAALDAYQNAITCAPDFFEAYYQKGNLLFEMKQYTEAINFLEKACALNNQNADAYNGLGVAYIYTDQLVKALAAFEQALRLNPDYEIAQRNLTVLKEALSQ